MTKLIFLFAFKLIVIAGSSQQIGQDKQNNVSAVGGALGNTVRQEKKHYEGIQGSPLLLKKFSPGKILLEDGNEYSGVVINIDLLTHEFLAMRTQSDLILVIDTKKIKRCVAQINVDSALLIDKVILPKTGTTFCWILSEGSKGRLLVHTRKIVKKADFSGAYSRGSTVDEIYEENDFYFQAPAAPMQSLTIRKKSILTMFPEDKDRIDTYFDEKDPNLKDLGHVKLLFNFLLQ